MKYLKEAAALGLVAALCLGGCGGDQTVTEDNAPSDLLKKAAAITSESDGKDLEEVLHELVRQTGEANQYRLILEENEQEQNLEENGGKLSAVNTDYEVYDVRYAGDAHFYQVYEEQTSDSSTWELMDSTPNAITRVYVTPVKEDEFGSEEARVIVDSISGDPGEQAGNEDNVQTIVSNSIVYPIYLQTGSTLLLNPTEHPEDYNFQLMKKGDTYEWTISMKDEESYNKKMDQAYQEAYGALRTDIYEDSSFVLDSRDVKEVRIVITMDQEGTISKIENSTKTTAVYQDQSLDLTSNNTLNIKAAPEDWHEFFRTFFEQTANGKIGVADEVTILPKKGDSDLSVQSEDSK